MWQEETISSSYPQPWIPDLLELGGVSAVACLAQLPTWTGVPCKYPISNMLLSSVCLHSSIDGVLIPRSWLSRAYWKQLPYVEPRTCINKILLVNCHIVLNTLLRAVEAFPYQISPRPCKMGSYSHFPLKGTEAREVQ